MDTAPRAEADGGPWYRHFWPWFIVAMLGTAVVASLSTVFIAFMNRDALVRDDYYEDGTAINRRLELFHSAQRHGVVAVLDFAGGEASGVDGRGDVALDLAGRDLGDVDWLRLELSHPTRAERDRLVMLSRTADGRFHGRIGEALRGRWYAILEPAPIPAQAAGEPGRALPVPWRLSATIHLPSPGPITLRGEPESAGR